MVEPTTFVLQVHTPAIWVAKAEFKITVTNFTVNGIKSGLHSYQEIDWLFVYKMQVILYLFYKKQKQKQKRAAFQYKIWVSAGRSMELEFWGLNIILLWLLYVNI